MRGKYTRIKRMLSLFISCFMIFSLSVNAFAATSAAEEPYFIVNGEKVVRLNENYENPETGEYFRWVTNPNARGTIAKSFEFKIRYSVTSSKFTVDSSTVTVSSSAQVQDRYGYNQSGYSGHAYQIQVTGIYSRNLYFSVGGTESGTISNLESGGSYKVTIINNDYLNDSLYLVGSGTIRNS